MMDKLEVRVPSNVAIMPGQKIGTTPFRKEFLELVADTMSDEKHNPFRPSRHYRQVGDLREFGYDVVAHFDNRHAKHESGSHKLEFIDVGGMGFSRVAGELERIVAIDPLKLQTMRFDAAADVSGVGVGWFHDRARVKWKRFVNEIGKLVVEDADGNQVLPYSQMGARGIETLYFGKRPNCFRIYNKIAELKEQYRKLSRGRDVTALIRRMQKAGATSEEIAWRLRQEQVNPDAEASALPSFQDLFHYPEHGYVLTRVERQMASGLIPAELATLRDIAQRAADFNPYDNLQIVQGIQSEPVRENYSPMTWLAGQALKQWIERDGFSAVQKELNGWCRIKADGSVGQPGRHAKYYFETLKEFLPRDNGLEGEGLVSAAELYERYRDSMLRQLAA